MQQKKKYKWCVPLGKRIMICNINIKLEMLTVFFNYETSLTCCSPFLWGILSILGKASGSFSLLRNRYNKGSSLLFPTPFGARRRNDVEIVLLSLLKWIASQREKRQNNREKERRHEFFVVLASFLVLSARYSGLFFQRI